MPRMDGKGADRLGIQFSGSVVRGEKSVAEGLREAGLRERESLVEELVDVRKTARESGRGSMTIW